MGWFQDSKRHSLAARGVETGRKQGASGSMNAKPIHPLEKAARDFFAAKNEDSAHDTLTEAEAKEAILQINPQAQVSQSDIAIMQKEFREAQEMKRRGQI